MSGSREFASASSPITRRIAPIFVAALMAGAGCGSSTENNGDGSVDTVNGSGGQTGSGGAVGSGGSGAGSGGQTGSGGAVGSGGGTSASYLPVPPGSANVPKPSGTPGNLTILPWAGFKGAVTYTFDDANSSQIAHYAELQALGVRYTFYLWTNRTEASNAIWAQAVKDGHELGNHTQTHPQTGTAAELDNASAFILQKYGVTAYTMAAPYGDASYVSLAQTRFLVNRGVANGLVGPNDSTNPFNLFCYIPPTNALASAFNAEVDAARTAGKWKIVLVHGFTGGTDSAYQPVSITEFTSGVSYAKSLGDMWIDSMVNVAAYWRGQKVVSGVTPTTSGSDKTWTWTLPDHFPPGKVLRVKVDGGTLKQGSATLAWDPHGYYEVSLDAGTLTLTP